MPNNIYIDLAITQNFIIVESDVALLEAIRRMNQANAVTRAHQSKHEWLLDQEVCVLVTAHNRLIGIFTKGDVLRLIEQQVDLLKVKIGDAIIQSAIAIPYSQIPDLVTMFSFLENSPYPYLPVVDGFGQILGVVTPESYLLAKNQQAEDTLKNVEAQKKAILTAIPDLIYRISEDGTYLECFSSNYVTDLLPSDLDMVNKH
ncbi:MAG: CBS domain-containing protein, partial [Pseudanabaena sp.]